MLILLQTGLKLAVEHGKSTLPKTKFATFLEQLELFFSSTSVLPVMTTPPMITEVALLDAPLKLLDSLLAYNTVYGGVATTINDH